MMRRTVSAAVLLLSASPPVRLSAQSTSLTVYNDGRLLVRRSIPANIPRGQLTLRLDLGVRDVDPGSFVSLDDAIAIVGVRHAAALGQNAALRRMVGQDVTFRAGGADTVRYVTGRLLSVDPFAVRVDGWVMYAMPGIPLFPDSLVQISPDVDLTVDASRQASSMRLLYQSRGISWAASYGLLLPRGASGQATISGTATITNGAALSLRGAEVQLLAGDVRRAQQPRPMAAARMDMAQANLESVEITQEGLAGTHLYTLAGTHDFTPGETRALPLFPRAQVDVEREFVLNSSGYGFQQQWPDQMADLHPELAWRVRRPAGAAESFGQTPMPAGVVRLYEPDAAGRPQLAGEVAIAHTPAGRDLRLVTGTAFDVTATKVQTQYQPVSQREAISSYRVELRNAKNEAVTVLVTDQCPGRCDVLSSSIPAERGNASMVGFRVTVPASGSATLEYRLRARW